MSRIYWDTMLFVYLLENHPVYAKRVQQIRSRMNERHDRLYTSAFTVGEILTGTYKAGDAASAKQIRDFFEGPFIEIIPFTLAAADHYAKIRSQHRISPADGIHLACAAQVGTDLFLTNDASLNDKTIPGIQFIAPLDTNLF
ncbi:MAG TPA: type II toxin-antitoxin system VapC family toxin [Candidatus Angelobacter sp.]|jgi:predicted nucleic acid-binding protein|nr:type II toxin-antitoxin system VapC family toxin [Candidatus Angelobacter sp.]